VPTLLAAMVLSLVVIAVVEVLWRSAGHLPSVTDDKDLWSVQRHRINGNPKTLVLLGASRMQIDISIPVLARRLPETTVSQLAVDGLHPVAALQDLAEDPDFRGIVLCSIIASGFERRNWDHQQPYVDYNRNGSTLNRRISRRLGSFFQERLTVLNPWVKLKKTLIRYQKTKKWPAPFYLTTYASRERDADYTKLDIATHKKKRMERLKAFYEKKNPPKAVASWLEDVRQVEKWVSRIHRRGGKVVFIRFPTSETHWQMDQVYYPRHLYWDVMAADTAAATLHFRDVPAMNRFVLPDTSHLDFRDKPAFTETLIRQLDEMGILKTSW
jgi:hypothetical protein